MTKILVTGGAGFIGAHVTDRLIKLNHEVLVVDSLKTIGGIPFINRKCKFLKGDITSKATLKKIKKWKPKIIFHLAAQSCSETAYDNPKEDYLSNGMGTYLLALLAKEIKVKYFIYTSSVSVYGSKLKNNITEKSTIEPDSIYGISKYAGEMFVKQVYGVNNKCKECLKCILAKFCSDPLLVCRVNSHGKFQISVTAGYVLNEGRQVITTFL